MTTYLDNVWHISRDLAPWLFFGVLVAGLLHVLLPAGFIRRHLGSNSAWNVVKASIFGVPLPLCSCGAIPTALGLKRDGASSGAAMGFLVSTPQTGIDSITVSAVFLGFPFAVFKVVSALFAGIVVGLAVNLGDREGGTARPSSAAMATGRSAAAARSWREKGAEVISFAVDELLYPIWKWLLFGILLSAAISTLVPEAGLQDRAWTSGLAGMLLMLVISLPMYVCATSSVPIAAALVMAGLPTGAALVFLVAGPATNVATIGAIYGEFGRRVTLLYLGLIGAISIFFGMVFELLPWEFMRPRMAEVAEESRIGAVAAVVLFFLFLHFIWREFHPRSKCE